MYKLKGFINMDIVQDMGRKEGKRLRIYSELEEVNVDIPFFQVEGHNVKIGGYKNHDNAPRMLFWGKYLQTRIFPFLEKGINLDGFYNIELHDSYTHVQSVMDDRSYRNKTNVQEGAKEKNKYETNDFAGAIDSYKNCLVWSKHQDDDHVVLLPDMYQLVNYHNKFCDPQKKDYLSWEDKIDKIGFWGTTTGHHDPTKNKRIQSCLWFHEKDQTHSLADCYITNVAQIPMHTILDKIPKFSVLYTSPVDAMYQYKYKFLLDIPGNTCSWDRVPLIMNSRSLFFKTPSDDMCFYYPLLKNRENFVHTHFEDDDVLKQRTYFLNNTRESNFIVQKANAFAREYLNAQRAQEYLIHLFSEASHHKA